MSFKDFIQGFIETSKLYIQKFENYSELNGLDKKKRLDEIIISYCNNALLNSSLNFFFKFLLKKYVIPNISYITQAIFDLIKTNIAGITE
ncbi:MAG: hypothetical protein IKR34_04620 [Candidatus Gastranaerophilales bacterium]|nr:hypothetical protein [Candidatus Gastranaerophilales bacterium]